MFFPDGLGVVGSIEVGSNARIFDGEVKLSLTLEGDGDGGFWGAGLGEIAAGGCGVFFGWKICESGRELGRESEGGVIGGDCWSCSC